MKAELPPFFKKKNLCSHSLEQKYSAVPPDGVNVLQSPHKGQHKP